MGLHVDYFSLNSGYTSLADVDFNSEPTDTSSVEELNINRMRGAFWEGGAKNYFAARYHGDLNVSQAGSYTFYLKSDSNAVLFLNGEPVTENVGGRGGRKSEVTLDLSEGAHDIEVRYFDGRGRSTLQLEWKGPDSDGQREVIGGDAFSKDEPPVEDDKDTGGNDDPTGDDTGSDDHDHGDDTGTGDDDTTGDDTGSDDHDHDDDTGTGDDDTTGDDTGSSDHDHDDDTGTGDDDTTGDDTGSGDHDHGDHDHSDDDTGSDHQGDNDQSGDSSTNSRQGLQGTYFALPFMVASLDEIDFDGTPTETGSTDSLNFMDGDSPFWQGGPADLFAVRYQGNLNVEQAGSYTFYLNSDDGSALYIDGVPVINNDGLHGTLEQTVTLDLSAGAHDIEIRYFEAYGKATLALEWAGPDSGDRREVIQGDALSYVAGNETGDGTDTGGDGTDSGDHDHDDDQGSDDNTGGDDTGSGDHDHDDDDTGDDTGSGDHDHDDNDQGSDDDTDGDDTGSGDHDHDDDDTGDDTGSGDHDHDDDDQGSDDDTDGDDTGSGDHDHDGDDSGDDTGSGEHDHSDDDNDDDSGSGGHDHDNHSDGHVPPPTSPDEVDAYVEAIRAQPESHAHGDDSGKATEHVELLNLVSRADATHIAVNDGDWFDPNTWHDGNVPGAGAQVLIPEAISVNYSGESDASLFTVRVDGELTFAHDADSKMLVDTMVVSPTGRLEIGTEDNPIGAEFDVEIVIANNGDIDTGWDPMLLSRGVISHGEVEIHGAEKTSFLTVSDAPMAGDTQISLSEIPEGWQVGDTIVLTGTHKEGWYWDNDARTMRRHDSQDEEVVITAIDGNTITLDRALEHDHDAPRDDLAAYVANTSRNVTFSSEDGDDTAIHHRGHTMFMHSDDVDVRYAAFDDLGRTDKSEPAFDVTSLGSVQPDSNVKARYPFHFHRTGTEDQENPAIAIGNSVSGSPGWGYAHHDSHAIFTDNVAFDIFGAAFVAEDGNETGVWSHNIAINTVGIGYGESAIKQQSDVDRHDNGRTGEGFFFAGRLVEASDNVAANTTHGYVWMTRGHPRDPLSENLDQPEIAYGSDSIRLDQPPIQGFHNNEAFGTEVGLVVIKEGPNQHHDVRSVLDGFVNWETSQGVDLSYSSHYTLIDFDLLATQSDNPNIIRDTGFNLGGNAFDIVANGMRVEGFRTGIDLEQDFHFGTNGVDYDDVFIDLVQVNVGTEFAGFDPSRHSVISSDSLVEGRLGFILESDTVISEGENLVLRGLKTDSIGSRDREFAGDQQTLFWHEDIAALIANEGYYKTETGQNVLLIEDFVADRATGDLFKITHVITLDMTDAQIANSWSVNQWGGAQYNGVIELDNLTPTARDDSASTSAGTSVLIDVLANDSHASGDDIRVDGLSTTPNGNVYVQEDGQLLYMPNPDFVGVDTFDYWAADEDGDFSQATVTVEVFDL